MTERRYTERRYTEEESTTIHTREARADRAQARALLKSIRDMISEA
jgi:hypothetical protein